MPREMTQSSGVSTPVAPFFWLHIKKSAGITTRAMLQPHYRQVDRTQNPKTFIQADPSEYNDILNNYRVVLGEYQFKRSLFARTYLYPNRWDQMVSFAFAREPVDRAVSMFYYLFWRDKSVLGQIKQTARMAIRHRTFAPNASYAFDVFLDHAARARTSGTIYDPLGLHFTTHTAPMSDDVTDNDGQVMLRKIYRLEHLAGGINEVFEMCGLARPEQTSNTRKNRNTARSAFAPSTAQIRKIEDIYGRDFDLYENADVPA